MKDLALLRRETEQLSQLAIQKNNHTVWGVADFILQFEDLASMIAQLYKVDKGAVRERLKEHLSKTDHNLSRVYFQCMHCHKDVHHVIYGHSLTPAVQIGK